MNALEIFRRHRDELCAAWVDAVFSTYELDTKGFLRTKKDPFLNPVGDMTQQCARFLYDAAAGEDLTDEQVRDGIARLVKLRAVQDYPASHGLGVLFLMKNILRGKLLPLFAQADMLPGYLEAESRLDTVALMAFDLYTRDRELVLEQRIKEIKNQHAQLVRWARTVDGGPVGGSGEPKL